MSKEFEVKSVAILGRQPELGLAELESLYGSQSLKAVDGTAFLSLEASQIDFRRLGGTVKLAQVLAVLNSDKWSAAEKFLIESVPKHLEDRSGKFNLGLSAYGFGINAHQVGKTALAVKKAYEGSMRVVPNKTPALSSAQVLHNKLTTKGGWELLVIKSGDETILAQTLFVQDIEAYAARDQARPKRDARVGMLPPKLAQVLVNLAIGMPDLSKNNKMFNIAEGNKIFVVLDPFCGTGVVLQEALIMGYSVYGTDLEPRMIEYTKENLRWLVGRHPELQGRVVAEPADATSANWPGFSAVATEAYLGRPLAKLPSPLELDKIINDVNTITKKFLHNLSRQMKTGRKAALALPAWRVGGSFKTLPVVDGLTDMGYNPVKFKHVGNGGLIYHREGQIVGRQIIVLEKQ